MSAQIEKIEKFSKNLAGLSLFILMIMMATDVFARTVFSSPISGVTEIGQYYLMVAIVFFGLPYTYRVGGHVRVEILATRFGPRFWFVTELLGQILGIVTFLIIVWFTLQFGLEGVKIRAARPSGAFILPVYPARFIVPLSSLLMVVTMVSSLIRTIIDFRSGRLSKDSA